MTKIKIKDKNKINIKKLMHDIPNLSFNGPFDEKKILILGSHSFSGSALVEKLLEKNKLDLILIYNNKKIFFFLLTNSIKILLSIKN